MLDRVFISPKVETSCSRILSKKSLFSKNPRFTRKHYEQETLLHGKSQAIVLSYDIGKQLGDSFFNNFLPDLNKSLNPPPNNILANDLIRTPQHDGIFSTITRGKYLRHFIERKPESAKVYTYNAKLDRASLVDINNQIEIFEALPIPTLGTGNFILTDVSMSYRRHRFDAYGVEILDKPNEFNFVFKFSFVPNPCPADLLSAKFLNDNFYPYAIIINIHFTRDIGCNADYVDAKGNYVTIIKTKDELKNFLTQSLMEFNDAIAKEISIPDILNLNADFLDGATPHLAAKMAAGIAGITLGNWPPASATGFCDLRYNRATAPKSLEKKIKGLYQPNSKKSTTLLLVHINHALFNAARNGNLAIVQSLINMGADVNSLHIDNGIEKTPLKIAIEQGHDNIRDELLSCGAVFTTQAQIFMQTFSANHTFFDRKSTGVGFGSVSQHRVYR